MNDAQEIQQLCKIRQQNNDFAWLMSDFLNDHATAISADLMHEMDPDGFLPTQTLYIAILSGLLNLIPEENQNDKILIDNYLRESIHLLDTSLYAANPYYKNIHISETTYKNWKLTKTTYKPFEAFVFQDIILKNDYREIPQIGFFSKSFSFPAVHENNREWMAIKPNEIETIQPAIDAVSGNVITFGLGMGYFAYMASIKQSVSSVTIIERDNAVIQLFERFILPQFEQKNKIHIIQSDAFEFINSKMSQLSFDFAFVDLWHDVSDGLPLYQKMKKLEHTIPQTKFLYWVEDSLLSAVRWNSFDTIIANSTSYDEACRLLSNSELKKLL